MIAPVPFYVFPAILIASAVMVVSSRNPAVALDFGGSLGIAVVDVESGWSTGFDAERLLPQQSVSKTWVALTALAQGLGEIRRLPPEIIEKLHELRALVHKTGQKRRESVISFYAKTEENTITPKAIIPCQELG